jgi:outer membrane receptor protein involved in Fe transport
MIPRSSNLPRTLHLAAKRAKGSAASLLLALLVMGSSSLLEAQGVGTITGRVVNDATRQPLAAAQVFVAGTQLGTLTTDQGSFRILNVPAGDHQLQFKLIGMRPLIVPISVRAGATVTVDTSMHEQSFSLDQVVVTGTVGGARAREVGNSITSFDVSKEPQIPISMETLLQTEAPGMTVMQSSGQIGGAAQIRLRGVVSASMSNQPLVYIDGVRVRSEAYPNPSVVGKRSNNENQSPLNDINPSDIDRIEIIKGAAASTLYGTEAAAGVIQIFTKRGAAGSPMWTLETRQGFSQEQAFAPDPAPYFYLDPWLKRGSSQQNSISVSGGADLLKYFMSATRENDTGILPNESLGRSSFRGNFTFSPLRDLTLAWNTSYSAGQTSNVAGGVNPSSFIYNVMRGSTNFVSSLDPAVISKTLNQEFLSGIDRLVTGLTATYAPTSNWTTRFTVGYDQATNILTQLRPYGFVLQATGDLNLVNFASKQGTVDLSSTINFNITKKVTSAFSIGAQAVQNTEQNQTGYSANFAGPGSPTLSSGSIQTNSETFQKVITGGFFAQNVFGFSDKAFLTAGVRVDGSSAFGASFGLQVYPKVSASYVLSDEKFWHEKWGSLKLRYALGAAGRAPGAFDAVRTWNPVGWGTSAAYQPLNVGNADLGPERTVETEIGFDWSVFDGRIATTFTSYHGRTHNALFPVTSIPSTGFQNSQLANVGTTDNQGTEITTDFKILERKNLSWSFGANVATNHSMVVSLGGAPSVSLGNAAWLIQGQPLYVVQGVQLMNPNAIADPVVTLKHNFGPNNPTLILGGNTTLVLPYGITLSARGEFQGGNFEDDASTDNGASRNITTWPTCLSYFAMVGAGNQAQTTAYSRLRCQAKFYQPNIFIEKADFFKVRDITLRIPIPMHNRGGIKSALFSVSLHNWIKWVNKDFPIFDPEVDGEGQPAIQRVRATGDGQIPPPRTATAALRIVF